MENVEIKKEESKAVVKKKPAKKPAKNAKADPGLVKFMESRNEARKKAGLAPAYTEEQIKAHK